MIPLRLDKYLGDATPLSRSDIEAAWEAGRIDVEAAEQPWVDDYTLSSLIFEEDVVRLDGEVVEPSEPSHYYALHKPAGVLSTTSDPEDRPCLARWLDELPDAVFPVGRLDRPTTGLLVLTDDGDLCFCLLRPRFGIEKEYRLTIRGRLEKGDRRVGALEQGVDIGDDRPPASALRTEIIKTGPRRSLLSVVVDEGRHRMIRRMARRADLKLEHLHRSRIGPLRMNDLEPGEQRPLSDDEVERLWEAAGGRKASRRRQVAALKRRAERWRDEGRPHRRLERWLVAESRPGSGTTNSG